MARALLRALGGARRAENAEATTFLEALLFRRYEAKLQFELDFWARFPEDGGTPIGYAERLTAATGFRYRQRRLPRATWTRASTRPTTCARGSARHSFAGT